MCWQVDMKDRIRYGEALKLKVMAELRDAKRKSVKEAVTAYGIAEMSVYNWMRKLGFKHQMEVHFCERRCLSRS